MIRPAITRTEPTSRRSKRSVARFARALVVAGSGNQPNRRGDLSLDRYLGEHKTTLQAGYRLTRATLAKITNEAQAVGKTPFFALEFASDEAGVYSETWIALPAYALRGLLGG